MNSCSYIRLNKLVLHKLNLLCIIMRKKTFLLIFLSETTTLTIAQIHDPTSWSHEMKMTSKATANVIQRANIEIC